MYWSDENKNYVHYGYINGRTEDLVRKIHFALKVYKWNLRLDVSATMLKWNLIVIWNHELPLKSRVKNSDYTT